MTKKDESKLMFYTKWVKKSILFYSFEKKSGISQVYKVDKISLLIGYVMYNLDCIIQ